MIHNDGTEGSRRLYTRRALRDSIPIEVHTSLWSFGWRAEHDWPVEWDRLRYGWGCADSAAVEIRLNGVHGTCPGRLI